MLHPQQNEKCVPSNVVFVAAVPLSMKFLSNVHAHCCLHSSARIMWNSGGQGGRQGGDNIVGVGEARGEAGGEAGGEALTWI